MKGLRRQPPAYSPLPPAALLRGAAALMRRGTDPRDTLAAQLCREYHSQTAWLLGSGTQALQLALELGRAALGDALALVALPAFNCFDVASAAVGAAARVTFYDIDPGSLGPDLASLRTALRQGARIVVVSPLYGMPVNWDEVADLAREHEALVIEDAAQGFGAGWRGEPLGSLGTLSVLSFGRGKGWTGGAGGALLFRKEPGLLGPLASCRERAPRARLGSRPKNHGGVRGGRPRTAECEGSAFLGSLRDPTLLAELDVLARAAAQHLLGNPALYGAPAAIPMLRLGTTRYHPPRRPRAMSRCCAALLLASHSAARAEAAARHATGDLLRVVAEAAGGSGLVTPPADGRPGYLRFPWREPGGLAGLPSPGRALRLGVAPSYPTPLTHLEPLRPLAVRQDRAFPGARDLASQLLTLPTHSLLAPEELRECLALLRLRSHAAPPYTGGAGRAHADEPEAATPSPAGERSSSW